MNHQDAEDAIRRLLDLPPGHPSGPCPDANEMAAYLEARLSSAESARFEAHAADCASCREALALSLQLGEEEQKNAVAPVPETRSFSYRVSPFRLVFAGTVLVVVGAILFQATREVPVTKETPQVAAVPVHPDVSGGPEASMSSATPPRQAVAPAAAVPSPRPAESIRAGAGTADAPVFAPTKPSLPAAPPPALALETGNLPRSQPATRSDAEHRKALEDLVTETIKARRAAADGQLAKTKALARPEEAKPRAAQISQALNQIALPGAQNTLPSVQNTLLQAQNVLPPSQIDSKIQAALPAGQVTRRAVPMTQQAASDRMGAAQVQQAQESRAAQQTGARSEPIAKAGTAQTRGMSFAETDLVGKALSEARAAQSKGKGEEGTQKAGARLFYRTADFWVDAESLAHADAPAHAIARDGKEHKEIIAKEPALGRLTPAGTPVLVYWNGTNLLIR